MQPFYDYVAGQYVYTPGYWRSGRDVPQGWNRRPMRDSRPTIVEPPPGYHAPARPIAPQRPVRR